MKIFPEGPPGGLERLHPRRTHPGLSSVRTRKDAAAIRRSISKVPGCLFPELPDASPARTAAGRQKTGPRLPGPSRRFAMPHSHARHSPRHRPANDRLALQPLDASSATFCGRPCHRNTFLCPTAPASHPRKAADRKPARPSTRESFGTNCSSEKYSPASSSSAVTHRRPFIGGIHLIEISEGDAAPLAKFSPARDWPIRDLAGNHGGADAADCGPCTTRDLRAPQRTG